MIEVALSTVEEVCLAGQELFAAHAAEIEPENAERLNPDWDSYQEHETNGNLLVVAAWDGRDLVGYICALIYQSLHYREEIHCQVDVFYVDPQARRQRAGLRLLNKMRGEAHARGACMLRLHAKPDTQLDRMLRLLNFQVEESLFTEDLASWAQAES